MTRSMRIASAAIAALAMLSMTACASGKTSASTSAPTSTAVSGIVTASGSSALLPLAQAAADQFMAQNSNCVITVNGGGSGTGLKQVADGSVDIGDSDVFAEEKLDAATAAKLVDHKVAIVTMTAVVNKDLGVKDLTSDQLIGIFTGTITNWKDVGGPDEKILLVTRPSSSGTRALFKKWALNGSEEASNAALETDDSGTLVQTIADNKGAIGYVALSYLANNTNIKSVAINGIEPTLENTYNGSYMVWGYEHMYTKGEGSDAAKAFISYMMSDDFSVKLEGMGYGTAAKLTSKAIDSHK